MIAWPRASTALGLALIIPEWLTMGDSMAPWSLVLGVEGFYSCLEPGEKRMFFQPVDLEYCSMCLSPSLE